MVKQYKRMFNPNFAILTLCVAIANISVSYADGFYTIIGPDGRPMIVPSKRVDQKKQTSSKIEETQHQNPTTNTIVVPAQKVFKEEARNTDSLKRVEQQPQKKLNSAPTAPQKTQTAIVADKELKTSTEKTKSLEGEKVQPVANNEWKKKIILVPPPIKNTSQAVPSAVSSQDKSKFTTIDNVEYVNNEYLEDQEFNLEGKKRFYLMPDGLGRTESIERKKGVSRSTLDQLFNRQAKDEESTVVLAPTYMRLSSQELEAAFEQDKCFIKGYNKQIKTLSINKEVNLWPRKPLKEKFEYEVVQLNPSVQHLKFMSFAASNEKPLYYWPLIIFLDDKGCILEGVSGFKSKYYPSTMLQHASLQGVLKVPSSAHYMMMTPLSSAVDVAEKELTNQGQIQISVLR
ncbi:putative pilus assembly protein FilE [Acinetobacter oleivorans]|uniref:putative pilus assembly protein FilE n=1 Tax=Acinetobacter oleivorans TaxID=1148157 RepID=UPI00157FE2FD|nr:putative pilus assembly protein FilE [Acinetobacter oleivorans]NUF10615.1 putative pilus assembly protein FilE [Acinetobacter oleivorans]